MKHSRIKTTTFGGRGGWYLRKYFSSYTSKAYLDFQYFIRKRLFKKYIDKFCGNDVIWMPCLISIETINRCNSECSFCPANRNVDKRPLKKWMTLCFIR